MTERLGPPSDTDLQGREELRRRYEHLGYDATRKPLDTAPPMERALWQARQDVLRLLAATSAPRENGWEELRREIEALPGHLLQQLAAPDRWIDRRAVLRRLAAARGESGLREALDAFFEDIDADWTNDNIRPGDFAFRFRHAADRLRAAIAATPTPREDGWEAETLARWFHEAYERLAPFHGYATRPESAVAWESVPTNNRALMVATAAEVLPRLAAARGEPPDVDALLATLRDRFHEARAGTPEWRDGIRLGLEIAMNEVSYWATPTTPEPDPRGRDWRNDRIRAATPEPDPQA